MNELFKVLAERLKGVELGSKAVAVLVLLALAGALGVGAVLSKRPHFELAFSGLSDHEVAEVNKALAEAGLSFEVSQPPAPFSVYVARDERSAAYRAAYAAGALDRPLKGILAESGVTSVFQGSEERLQGVRKREWQEMEGMLEVLDFVVAARVRTSSGMVSPVTGRAGPPTGASVTLRLAGGELSDAQAQTVAQLVSRGLGIDQERIVISDQAGNQLFDGQARESDERKVGDLLAHRERNDQEATRAANAVLERILGRGKAEIAVRSEWDYDQSTVRTESASGKATLVSEHKNTSETPIERAGSSTASAAGIESNVATGEAPQEAAPAQPPEPLVARTNQEEKEYKQPFSTEERVRFVPTLKRLSVAVFLDESIAPELSLQLDEAIKAAVGFVDGRDDFRSVRLPFAPADEGAQDGAADEAPAEPNRLLELFLQRGVEVAVSVVFLVLLLKSLKSAARKGDAARPEAAAEAEIDPELLARARVDELLRSDPEQVGTILSAWARGEPTAGARS